MAAETQPRNENSEARVPERVESRSESPAVSTQVFGNVGDRNDLALLNTHTRGAAGSGNALELTNPFEEVASGRKSGAPAKPHIPDALKEFMSPPTNPALLKDGVVKITPTFPGTGKFTIDGSGNGTGFLVNVNGDKGASKPGEQLIATSDHVVTDRQRDIYALGPNLFKDKQDLSRADLDRAGEQALEGVDNSKPHEIFKSKRDYARDELNYIRGNFDAISKVSRELDPSAKGITLDGLDEYRRRNTRLEVETAAGTFSATIANREPGADVAVLRIAGLTADQQKRIGPNKEFETEQLSMEQPVKSVGFKKTVESKIDGVEQITSLKDTKVSIAVDQPLEKGMSGGPSFARNYKVIGLNHATGRESGFITPITELRPLLKEIAEGKVKIRRSL